MGYFQVRYDSRVVKYERKLFIRLATGIAEPTQVLEVRPVNNQTGAYLLDVIPWNNSNNLLDFLILNIYDLKFTNII